MSDLLYDVPHTVYLHRDAAGQVIYVGLTSQLRYRTWNHRSSSLWRDSIASIEVDSVHPNWHEGRAREVALIRQYEPLHNCQGNPQRERARAERQRLLDVADKGFRLACQRSPSYQAWLSAVADSIACLGAEPRATLPPKPTPEQIFAEAEALTEAAS